MVTGSPKPALKFAPLSGNEPTFHITHAIFEAQRDGTIRASKYEEVNGELVLQFTEIVMPANMAVINASARETIAVAHNIMVGHAIWDESSDEIH